MTLDAESTRKMQASVRMNEAQSTDARSDDTRALETLSIRAMCIADLFEVMRIEYASYQLPWSEQIIKDCLNVGYHCLVLESQHGIAGYVIFSSAAGESHILNLCIDPLQRSNGYAHALLTQAMAVVIVAGAKIMFLEVRESNRHAIRLYEKTGFIETGRRENYYKIAETGQKNPTEREDALVMARDLTL